MLQVSMPEYAICLCKTINHLLELVFTVMIEQHNNKPSETHCHYKVKTEESGIWYRTVRYIFWFFFIFSEIKL